MGNASTTLASITSIIFVTILTQSSRLQPLEAHERGEKVIIEHVSPTRAFTRDAIAEIDKVKSDQEFMDYVKRNYRLVLLTAEETRRLNKMNRSQMTPDRLGRANISIANRVARAFT